MSVAVRLLLPLVVALGLVGVHADDLDGLGECIVACCCFLCNEGFWKLIGSILTCCCTEECCQGIGNLLTCCCTDECCNSFGNIECPSCNPCPQDSECGHHLTQPCSGDSEGWSCPDSLCASDDSETCCFFFRRIDDDTEAPDLNPSDDSHRTDYIFVDGRSTPRNRDRDHWSGGGVAGRAPRQRTETTHGRSKPQPPPRQHMAYPPVYYPPPTQHMDLPSNRPPPVICPPPPSYQGPAVRRRRRKYRLRRGACCCLFVSVLALGAIGGGLGGTLPNMGLKPGYNTPCADLQTQRTRTTGDFVDRAWFQYWAQYDAGLGQLTVNDNDQRLQEKFLIDDGHDTTHVQTQKSGVVTELGTVPWGSTIAAYPTAVSATLNGTKYDLKVSSVDQMQVTVAGNGYAAQLRHRTKIFTSFNVWEVIDAKQNQFGSVLFAKGNNKMKICVQESVNGVEDAWDKEKRQIAFLIADTARLKLKATPKNGTNKQKID